MSTEPRPSIRIVNEGGKGFNTHVYDKNGVELTCVTKVTWTAGVNELAKATLEVIAVKGELQAEVEAIRVKIVPEPLPREQYRFRITEGSATTRKWSLAKLTPLPTYGVAETFICGGAVAKDVPLVEIVADAPDG